MRRVWPLKAEIVTLIGLVVLLMTLGTIPASADTVSTVYCTGGNTCFSSNTGLTAYWTLKSDISLNTTLQNFAYTLTISETGETHPGYLQDFSGQYFSNGQTSNLAWVAGENPGNWADLSSSKAGNSGSCQGNATGAFCGSVDAGGSRVSLASGPVTFGITGSYTGNFLSNGTFNFQAAAANNSDGSGGNAFAISQPVGAGGSVPDGGMTLVLLGGAMFGVEALRRKFRV